MQKNDAIEQKLDSLLIDLENNKFSTVRTDSLTDEEREYLYKKAAIGMAHLIYRNGKIEDFHADSCKRARIPDTVMKEINKDVCNKCYELITACGVADKYVSYMIIKCYMNSKLYGHDWDEPTLVPLMLTLIKNEIIMKEEGDFKFGAELMYINKDTNVQDLMTFTFTDDMHFNVKVAEIEDEYLQDGVEYSFSDFIDIMAEHYLIVSYSVEYESDLI